MGVGAFACYKLDHVFPRHQHRRADHLLRLFRRGGRHRVRPAQPAHQGLLSRGRDAGRAVLPVVVLHPHSRGSTTTISRRRSRCRQRTLFGITGHRADARPPVTRYLIVLTIVAVMTWLASNLIRGRIGRTWMAVRDMDIAAELIGIQPAADQAARLRGVVVLLRRRRRDAGVPLARQRRVRKLRHQPVVPDAVHGDHRRARQPARLVFRRRLDLRACRSCCAFVPEWLGLPITSATVEHINFMTFGALIIFFLIVEPDGLARLWQIGKQKLRVWPFPY